MEVSTDCETSEVVLTNDKSVVAGESFNEGQGSLMIVASIINGVSSCAYFTLTQPMSFAGPIASLICIVVIAALYCYSSYNVARYSKPRTPLMFDLIVIKDYPKLKKPIMIITRLVTLFFMWSAILSLYEYFCLVIRDQIFLRFDRTKNTQLYIILPFLIVMALGSVRNSEIFVKLSGVSLIGSVMSVLCIMICARDITSEQWKCWRKGFTNPVTSGYFPVSWKEGWGSIFSLAGVISLCYMSQVFVHVNFAQAKKPSHNKKNIVYVYIAICLIYLIIWVCSTPRFACDVSQAQSLYLAQVNGEHWWFGILTQICYGFECLFSLPLFLAVARECSTDFVKTENKFYQFLLHNGCNLVLIILCTILTVKGVSLQFVLMIAGLLGTIVWLVGLPMIYHLTRIYGTKQYPKTLAMVIVISVVSLSAMILQFVLPVPI